MVQEQTFDAIVIGGGLAGMMAALEISRVSVGTAPRRVALVSYATLGESTSSAWAQGGIAAAVGADDSPMLHAADTVAAGAGLVEARVAARLAADAPGAIARVAQLGVRFDLDASAHYALGREAAHSRRRILKAGGDATGAELVRALAAAVRDCTHVIAFEGARALELVVAYERVCGLVVADRAGEIATLHAPAIVIATGGIGGLYRYTTNPTSSRGTGIAIAARAGARLADLEFVQFHPTALDVPSDPLPLVTEALRGEGAWLVDEMGARFMDGIDPALELAPRDVVARAVFAISQRGGHAYLDARSAVGARFPEHFPTVFASCSRFGIDPRTATIPVVAAAHYHMGGVAIDLEGRTSVAGLYACGEVAASGVHGANRLASNSLLESVVYPERIARAIAADAVAVDARFRGEHDRAFASFEVDDVLRLSPDARAIDAIREIMYNDVGVERDEMGLAHAVRALAEIGEGHPDRDVRDAALVGGLIAHAARRRCESRGSHARRDYPARAGETGQRSYSSLADLPASQPA